MTTESAQLSRLVTILDRLEPTIAKFKPCAEGGNVSSSVTTFNAGGWAMMASIALCMFTIGFSIAVLWFQSRDMDKINIAIGDLQAYRQLQSDQIAGALSRITVLEGKKP